MSSSLDGLGWLHWPAMAADEDEEDLVQFE